MFIVTVTFPALHSEVWPHFPQFCTFVNFLGNSGKNLLIIELRKFIVLFLRLRIKQKLAGKTVKKNSGDSYNFITAHLSNVYLIFFFFSRFPNT